MKAMKKRLSWAILALVLVFTNIGPISATGVNPDMEGEWVFLSEEQAAMVMSNDPDASVDMTADEDVPVPAAYTPVRGVVYSMSISPIAYVIIDGKEGLAQLDSISKTYKFNTYYQNAGVSLSSSDAAQLMGRLIDVCEAQADAYMLVGWLLDVQFHFEAASPQSFVWTGSGTNIETSDSSTLSLRGYGSSVTATCSYPFAYPQDLDIFEEKYNIEIGGMYRFQNDSGTTLSMKVSGTCSING